ncbi:MAG TPA: NrfD/PsrC family molybdoenzyme membrane anchor subunit [Polyangia bacterium]|nr:NrfD/PsrC family molybdoenzyme membrane anchor subunit [Polyangia bacterium]
MATAPAPHDPLEPLPLVVGAPDDHTINESLFQYVWKPTGRGWWTVFLISVAGVCWFLTAVVVTISKGIGTWGNNIPVAWAYGIINLVWWIGIGHAGTLISAILLLFQQKWRTSINRFAEAMTLFAVLCAAMYPALHLGRPWFAFWLFPYPSPTRMWPQFKSPLTWDVFAISTYFTVSLLFWYLGLIPDLAALRDASKKKLQRVAYGVMALGWRGSGRHWHDYRLAYLLLAGLSTPLVLSVHSIISWDFATSILPGWHTTIFPPYFVAGAVFSGFAMVLSLIIPARKFMKFEHVVTQKHIDNMCKVMLATGLVVAYGYLMEHFMAWYGGNQYEAFVFRNRRGGPYAPVFWTMIFCNVVVPQIFWTRRARYNLVIVWIASVLINLGMWTERFVIIVTSLHRDFMPSKWEMYYPTWVDWSLYGGTISFFLMCFLLFLRFLPAVAASEIKELRAEMVHDQGAH